jgi:ABC-type dipeptide/oligopeptide/nickel transport system permease component
MSEKIPPQLPEKNPVTWKAHSWQTFWQITLPILLCSLVAVGFAILAAAFASPEADSQWADISLIFLLVPVMVTAIIFLVIFAGLVFAFLQALKALPPYARLVQDFFAKVEREVRVRSDQVVEPFMRVHSSAAGLRYLGKRLRNLK